MANANRTEPHWLRRVRDSFLKSRNIWQDTQEIVGDLLFGNGAANLNKVDIASTRAQFGYDGECYINSANKTVRLRSGGIDGLVVTTARSVVVGRPSPATNAIDGFLYVPVVAGTPTGTPTAQTGYAPILVDSTGSKIWVYIGGAWKSATLA